MGYSAWGRKESDTTEQTKHSTCIHTYIALEPVKLLRRV